MRIADIIWQYWGDYYRENDSYKENDPEGKGRGFLQRYNESVIAKEADTYVLPRIEQFPKDYTFAPQVSLEFLSVLERSKGIDTPIFFDEYNRRKFITYFDFLIANKGSKKVYSFLFWQLGFRTITIQEFFYNTGLDGLNFDDPNPLVNFDTPDLPFSEFTIRLTSSPEINITPQIFEQIFNIINFNRPSHAILRAIFHNDIEIYNSTNLENEIELFTKTLGVENIEVFASTPQVWKAIYSDTSEQNANAANVVFTKTYTTDAEKSVIIRVGNQQSVVRITALQASVSQSPDLTNFTNLTDFEFSAVAAISLSLQTYRNLRVNFQAKNALNLSNCQNIERIEALNSSALTVNGSVKLQSTIASGLEDFEFINSGSQIGINPNHEIEFSDTILSDIDTHFDSFSAVRVKKFCVRNTASARLTESEYDLSLLSRLNFLLIECNEPSNKVIDFSGTDVIQARLVNTGSTLSFSANPEIQILEVSRTIDNKVEDIAAIQLSVINFSIGVSVIDLPNLQRLTISRGLQTGQVAIEKCPNLNTLIASGANLGSKASASARYLPILNISQLRELRLQKCGYTTLELNNILTMLIDRELNLGFDTNLNFDADFFNFDVQNIVFASGKILDLSNPANVTGTNNDLPSNSLINQLTAFGWSVIT